MCRNLFSLLFSVSKSPCKMCELLGNTVVSKNKFIKNILVLGENTKNIDTDEAEVMDL